MNEQAPEDAVEAQQPAESQEPPDDKLAFPDLNPGIAWGESITKQHADILGTMLQEWEEETEHAGRKGPFDINIIDIERFRRFGMKLTGADVFWLAARALAGTNEANAVAEAVERILSASSGHLNYLDLEGAFLDAAHLEGAFLNGAHLEHAMLSDAYLEGAYLKGANLQSSDLHAVHHLEGAHLDQAHLEAAFLHAAHLANASLDAAHLECASLELTHLEYAILAEAHLEGAILIGAHLEGTSLNEAHLEGASLLNAHLKEPTSKECI